MTESEENFWLDGEDGLIPYLRLKDKGIPRGKIEQIAWLLLNGSGCGFCKVCRDSPCEIKDGERCTGNIAKYIREIVLNEAESELQQYRAIGTVEECQEAREKQIRKKSIKKRFIPDGPLLDSCPFCGNYLSERHFANCSDCGQAIDWSE